VADIFYTVRKISLPAVLLETMELYFEQRGNLDYKARHLVDLCMDKMDSFNFLAVKVSDIRGYHHFLSTVFNKKT
jgi:hypothetical protein